MRKRNLLIGATVFFAVVFALGVALSPPRTPTVAVIGDRAGELRDVSAGERRDDATVTLVLLNKWDSLRHLPDIAELCWDACHDRRAGHIALTQMRFGATRKVVVFHLPSFDGDMDCIRSRALTEISALRAANPTCQPDIARMQVFILPMGLGRLS